MPWVPGVPIDHGADVDRPQPVSFCVLHRTIGTWPGDLSVMQNRLHSSPGTFNLLVGQAEGEWVQAYPYDTRCSHAAGGNDGPGIEFSGQNGEPLTDWQVRAGGHIIRFLAGVFGTTNFHDEPRIPVDDSGFRGFVNHRGIQCAPQWQHHDYVTGDEFARMTAGTTSVPKSGDDMHIALVPYNKDGIVNLAYIVDGGYMVDQIPSKPIGGFNVPQKAIDLSLAHNWYIQTYTPERWAKIAARSA